MGLTEATEALRVAIEAGDVEEAGRLLDANEGLADSRALTPPPLHFAVYVNRAEMVAALLDHGADIESRDQDNDTTPVRYAIVYARREPLKLLVERNASLGPKGDEGMTALDVALKGAEGGFEEFSELPSRAQYAEIAAWLRSIGAVTSQPRR